MNKMLLLKIIGCLLIIVFFGYLIINTDFNELIDNVKKTSLSIVLLLVGLQVVTQLLLGIQWHRITKKVINQSSYSKMLFILTTGTVIETLTPGAKIGGEVTRLHYLKKEMNAKTDEALNIIIIQKSISMSVLFSICIMSFIFICRQISIGLSLLSQILIICLCIFLIIFMISFIFFSGKLSNLLSKSDKKFIVKINKFVTSYSNSTKLINKKEWIIQFIISLLVWVLFPFKMAILAYSLGIELNFVILIAITMTSYMIATLPITPGGLGTFEGSMIFLFSLFSITSALSITATIVFRVITFWFVMVISVLYALIYKRITKVGDESEREDNKINS